MSITTTWCSYTYRSVQDFEFKLLSIWMSLFLTTCCPVWLSAIYLLGTSLFFMFCHVCLLAVSYHFQHFFPIWFVFCHIAPYLLSFLCTHSVYLRCDYVRCFCLLLQFCTYFVIYFFICALNITENEGLPSMIFSRFKQRLNWIENWGINKHSLNLSHYNLNNTQPKP